MDNEILGKSRVGTAGDDPCTTQATPLMMALGGVGRDQAQALQRAVESTGCRLYRATDGASGAHVLAGQPEDLGRLRNALLVTEDLLFVREIIEERLAELAAPHGLPQLTEDPQRLTKVAEEAEIPAGTTLRVSREFLFDAAHNLPRYNGKCERLHGHTFKIRVTVDAPLDTWSGMAFDFHDLKRIITGRVVDVLDHSYINEVIPNPSAEHLAIWTWTRLKDLPLHEVKVWETPTCCVTYKGPPRD